MVSLFFIIYILRETALELKLKKIMLTSKCKLDIVINVLFKRTSRKIFKNNVDIDFHV